MLELQLIYEGNGRYRAATKLDWQIGNERFGQGEIIEVRAGKKRSRKQNGWLHAMIAEAFDNQSAGPQFDDKEQLRAWLLIQAGHCDVKTFEANAMTREVAAWLRQTFRAVDFTTDGTSIFAKTPRSIAFKACGSAEMTEIANKVAEIIMADIVPGTTWADWQPYLDEGERLAAAARKRAAAKEAA